MIRKIPAFAAGIALWATTLLLVSIPKLFIMPIRILGGRSAMEWTLPAAVLLSPRREFSGVSRLSRAGRNIHRLDLDTLAGNRQQMALRAIAGSG
jgi:hypothetical protein